MTVALLLLDLLLGPLRYWLAMEGKTWLAGAVIVSCRSHFLHGI